jgi:putative tryptophan/tyrosine transport system substrate-binding protein
MKRREFIAGLGSATAWPVVARAQQAAMPVVGYLNSGSGEDARLLAAFRQGLKEVGYVERENVSIEYRFAQNQYDRLPELAADLVRRQVAVIAATGGPPPALAAKAATTTIPIVFNMGVDPVALGLVASLNRPGGNLTGVSSLNVELGQKRLELLHELVPTATTVALLLNPTNASVAERLSRDLQAAARTLGLQLHVLHASSEPDFDAAFATSVQLRAGALVIGTDGFLITRTAQLASLALRYAMPTMFQFREFAAAGGLMSYGGRVTDEYHLVGSYAGRILKGEKPGDLPVQQATRIELIINMKTAKALGLTVPQSILLRADEVIE